MGILNERIMGKPDGHFEQKRAFFMGILNKNRQKTGTLNASRQFDGHFEQVLPF
jgi:hypothetical protein